MFNKRSRHVCLDDLDESSCGCHVCISIAELISRGWSPQNVQLGEHLLPKYARQLLSHFVLKVSTSSSYPTSTSRISQCLLQLLWTATCYSFGKLSTSSELHVGVVPKGENEVARLFGNAVFIWGLFGCNMLGKRGG